MYPCATTSYHEDHKNREMKGTISRGPANWFNNTTTQCDPAYAGSGVPIGLTQSSKSLTCGSKLGAQTSQPSLIEARLQKLTSLIQYCINENDKIIHNFLTHDPAPQAARQFSKTRNTKVFMPQEMQSQKYFCLLYTSPSPRD